MLDMNNKQKIILWCGVIVVCLMGTFPPWKGYGYGFIGKPPQRQETRSDYASRGGKLVEPYTVTTSASKINLCTLGLQVAIVGVITATGIVTAGGSKRGKPPEPPDQ